MIRKGIIFSLLFTFALASQAQRWSKKKQYITIQYELSSAYFLGHDLSVFDNRFVSPGLGVGFTKKIKPRLALGVNLVKINTFTSNGLAINSKDRMSFTKYRNRTLRHGFFFNLEMYENRGTWKKRPDYNFYLISGADAMFMRHKQKTDGDNTMLIKDEVGYSLDWFTPVVYGGIGHSRKISKYVDLQIELVMNFTLTPHVDLDFNNNFQFDARNDQFLNLNIKLNNL